MVKYLVMQQITNFAREVRSEFNNIVWPTKREAARLSLIVILVSVAVGAFVGGLDFGFTNLMNKLINR